MHGKLQDFSGGYWHDWEFGYGHWALHDEVPGQKLFLWSMSRAGAIWQDLLTDNDGPYLESQTGRLLDQSDQEFLAPDSADRWREMYFPYKKIGPMVKATPYGALNVHRQGDALVVSFCALQNVAETLTVSDGGKQVATDRIVLKPMEVYQKSFPVSVGSGPTEGGCGRQALLHGRSQSRPTRSAPSTFTTPTRAPSRASTSPPNARRKGAPTFGLAEVPVAGGAGAARTCPP